MNILYAQCWEDPGLLTVALDLDDTDDVLSIASGGDNSFALLLDGAQSVTAVDYNPAQLHLVELKQRAIEALDYGDFVAFVGARQHRARGHLYDGLKQTLSAPCREYWDRHRADIEHGVIHSGRFERYVARFRRHLLPLVHPRSRVEALLAADSPVAQEAFYRDVWNSRLWRGLFRLFFSRPVLQTLGRRRAFFRHVAERDIAGVLLARTRRGLTRVPVGDNHFLEYMLTGHYRNLETAPPYLRPGNFEPLRRCLHRLHLVHSDLDSYLAGLKPRSLSAFNLSDVFEYMSPAEMERTLTQIVRVARPESRLGFWSLFVPRDIPARLQSRVAAVPLRDAHGRTFFYDRFLAWKIAGGAL